MMPARNDMSDRALIIEVEWLKGYDSPERVARRLGYDKRGSLSTRLNRAGRPDLGAWIDPHRGKIRGDDDEWE